MRTLIGISAALLLLAGAAQGRTAQVMARPQAVVEDGYDTPGSYDADTAPAFPADGNLGWNTIRGEEDEAALNGGMPPLSRVAPHRELLSRRDSNDGMAELNHAGSPSDDPHSGTASGISKQTAMPAASGR